MTIKALTENDKSSKKYLQIRHTYGSISVSDNNFFCLGTDVPSNAKSKTNLWLFQLNYQQILKFLNMLTAVEGFRYRIYCIHGSVFKKER